MKVFFDTSVLVAALVEAHPSHDSAFGWLRRARAGKIESFICSHTLAELYAVLTALPVSPKISPGMARRLIRDSVLSCARVVSLTARDYRSVIEIMTDLGIGGGTIYDALIARAAFKAGVDFLVTLNTRDFKRVCPEHSNIIRSP